MPPRTTPQAPPAQAPVPAGTTLEYFDPAEVAIGANYRTGRLTVPADDLDDDQLDALLGVDDAWAATLAAAGGNFDPVALLRRHDPADPRRYVIKHGGARRLRGCRRAGLPLLGYVCGDEDDNRSEDLARLVAQWRENHDRQITTAAADAAAIQGMLDLGMTEAAVCKTTRLKGGRDTIAAARKVAASPVAAALARQYPLDMAQTAVIAEFDVAGDDEAVAALEQTAETEPDQFAHKVAQLRDSAAERAQRQALLAEMQAAGVTVINEDHDTWRLRVAYLRDGDGERITPEQHAACPGHAAYLDSDHERVDGQWRRVWKAAYICTDAAGNGHTSTLDNGSGSGKTPAELETEREAKRRIRAGNAEWRAATKVRRGYVTASIVPLTTLPKAWAVQGYRLAVIASDSYALQYAVSRHHPLACHWLMGSDDKLNGDKDKLAALCATASPGRAVIELVLLLAAAERQAGNPDAWDSENYGYRNPRADLARYLLFLESTGYPLAPVEAHIAHGKRGKYKPQALPGARTGPPSTPEEDEP